MNWKPIETIPNVDASKGEHLRILIYSRRFGICTADAGNFRGHIFVNIPNVHGDYQDCGVTHWQPLPEPPSN